MKPMLACSTQPDLDAIRYPKYASTKLDGIRCTVVGGVALSRSLKPIPNLHVRKTLAKLDLSGCDGELMVRGDFNSVQSAVMSVHGTPDFTYEIFDYVDESKGFDDRLTEALRLVYLANSPIIKFLPQITVRSADEVSTLYKESLSLGNEGLILKDPKGKYKFGRSTMKEELMLKLKDVVSDVEAKIIGFKELEHNNNDAYYNDVGQQVRSNHQAFKELGGTLGALICMLNNKIFNIGSGFNERQRQILWDNRESYLGSLVKFKHLGLSKYGVPRCPIFLSIRDRRDL